MNDSLDNTSAVLDRSAFLAIWVLAVACSLSLLLAHEMESASTAVRTLWYTLSIAPPLAVALLLRSARDGYAWLCGAILAGLWLPLALHTGGDCDALPKPACDSVIAPYVLTSFAALTVLTAFLQTWRQHGRLSYPALYQFSWDNALMVAATGFFVGAAWLILVLWESLFRLIGFEFFHELFYSPPFAYPVTGLLVGFGLSLSRSQPGAMRALLRVCLLLGRALLPLIALLAVVFAVGLIFSGVERLWDTKRAASLLLALIFGVVALVNSVFQDGGDDRPYAAPARRMTEAGLLLLPLYAGLAAWALSMRVQQYGWTVDRLWAAILTALAALYALTYAFSVVRSSGGWLARIAPSNIAIALTLAALCLLSQSPVLDLRSIALRSQLALVERGELALEKLDLAYLRWDLGRGGVEALKALQQDAAVKADAVLGARVHAALTSEHRYAMHETPLLGADSFQVIPSQLPVPARLLEDIRLEAISMEKRWRFPPCVKDTQPCYLLALNLDQGPELEWVLTHSIGSGPVPVFGLRNGGYRLVAWAERLGNQHIVANESDQPLTADSVRVHEPRWKELQVGRQRFVIRDESTPP